DVVRSVQPLALVAVHQDLGTAVAGPARDAAIATLADDDAALQIERRPVALARIRPHQLGPLAGEDPVPLALPDVDEVVEPFGVPQRAFGESESRGQALGLRRLENRRQRVSHDAFLLLMAAQSQLARPSYVEERATPTGPLSPDSDIDGGQRGVA